jgi:hypothetical protein
MELLFKVRLTPEEVKNISKKFANDIVEKCTDEGNIELEFEHLFDDDFGTFLFIRAELVVYFEDIEGGDFDERLLVKTVSLLDLDVSVANDIEDGDNISLEDGLKDLFENNIVNLIRN